MSKFVRMLAVVTEGVRFLWVMRRAGTAYWKWRLGTVYGSFYRPSGKLPGPGELDVLAHRFLTDLWADAVADFDRVCSYLLWRRDMRRRCNRG